MKKIKVRLREGRTVIHVLADRAPAPGFEPVEGGLEEVYFATLHGERRRDGAAVPRATAGAH